MKSTYVLLCELGSMNHIDIYLRHPRYFGMVCTDDVFLQKTDKTNHRSEIILIIIIPPTS